MHFELLRFLSGRRRTIGSLDPLQLGRRDVESELSVIGATGSASRLMRRVARRVEEIARERLNDLLVW